MIVGTLVSTPFVGVDNAGILLKILNQLGPLCPLLNCTTVNSDSAHQGALLFMERYQKIVIF